MSKPFDVSEATKDWIVSQEKKIYLQGGNAEEVAKHQDFLRLYKENLVQARQQREQTL